MNKTKRAIFDAAIREFSVNGYSGATMDNVAISARVAKGTLYYHFKSKEEIFKYIITEGMKIITAEVDESAGQKVDSLSKLKAKCRVQLGMVYKYREFFKVVMSQLWGQELRHLELRKVVQNYIADIEKNLKEAMEEGFIRRGETLFMAYAFFGTMCSAAVYELINKDLTEVDEVIENLIEYVLKGIQI